MGCGESFKDHFKRVPEAAATLVTPTAAGGTPVRDPC